MEVYFILILPLFFLSQCVNTKPLHQYLQLGTTKSMNGEAGRNLVEPARFDRKMTSNQMSWINQKLLAIDDLEKRPQQASEGNKIKDDKGEAELISEREGKFVSVIESNSSETDQTYWIKVYHKVYNFSNFYLKKIKSFTPSSPRGLSLNSQNFKLKSLGQPIVPFDDVIYQSLSHSFHNHTFSPRRTESLSKKNHHVTEVQKRRLSHTDFDPEPPSQHFGTSFHTQLIHSESLKSHLTTDERSDNAKSTKSTPIGLKLSSKAAGKASRLGPDDLSFPDEQLRSEEDQSKIRSEMSAMGENDEIQTKSEKNARYEENSGNDRSEDPRQRLASLDRAVNAASVQTDDVLTTDNWDILWNEMINVYDRAEMKRESRDGDPSGIKHRLPWQQNGGFSSALDAEFDKDASANGLVAIDEDNASVISYLRDTLSADSASHSDQKSKVNTASSKSYIHQSNSIQLLESKWFFRVLLKTYPKIENILMKHRDNEFISLSPGFSFSKLFNRSKENPEVVNEKFGKSTLKVDSGSPQWNKYTDSVLQTSPSFSSQIQKVNLPTETMTHPNKILDKYNASPNLKFDYVSVDRERSTENDSTTKHEISHISENRTHKARHLSKTTKTQTEHRLRKRRDLNSDNSTVTLDAITSGTSVTTEEDPTSIVLITTATSFIEQSEEAVTMETELADAMRKGGFTEYAKSDRRNFTEDNKPDRRNHVKDSFESFHLVVSIQSDSSILYIMPCLVLITLFALAVEGVRRWRTIQKAKARLRLLPPSRGIDGDYTIDNPLAFDPDVPSTSKSQPGTSSEDSDSPGTGKGPFTISHTNEFPIFNTFPHRSRRMTQDRSSSFDSSRQCCCTWCLIQNNDVQTTRL